MKRICAILVIAAVLLVPGRAAGQASPANGNRPALTADAALLIDLSTGKVLYELNADELRYPASTTKIITAMLLLEHAQLNEVIVVGEEIKRIGPDSSTAKLRVGDRLTVLDMLHALLLASGNDAAYATAVYVARKASGFERMDTDMALRVFCDLMNEKAWQLGAKNTRFTGPDGYHDDGHYTTARDLALIARAALEYDVLRQVAATTEYHWQGRRWRNTNRLLHRDFPEEYYPWATGFKTGYTPEAGCCLVSTARGGKRELLGIVLNSTRAEVWKDTRNLLEYGFNSWKQYAMVVEGRQLLTVPVRGQGLGQPSMVRIMAGGTYSDLLNVEDIARLKLDFVWAEGVRKEDEAGLVLQAPIREGQVLGQALVTLEGEVLAEIEMIAAYGIKGGGWLSAGKLLLALALFAAVLFAILLRAFRTAGDSAAVRK
ncbi:MAG: D-alanyl-D-alanine carboxypeptidase [Firmicutes bacterium]|nr:D-alanyl-D-alanine carboxypeptidase [Bacillota bacterium]